MLPEAWLPESEPNERDGEQAQRSPHLLVLDINGLLIDRTLSVLLDNDGKPMEPSARTGSFCIYDRPGMRPFVAMLLSRFTVGVWSSARQHNLAGLVSHIFGDAASQLTFVWGQERCSYAGKSVRNKPLFLKELFRLWAEEQFAGFAPNNTLLLDDDVYKAARNPAHTAIHPTKYSHASNSTDTELQPDGALWAFLFQLSNEESVPAYVQQTNYGEAGRPTSAEALAQLMGENSEPKLPARQSVGDGEAVGEDGARDQGAHKRREKKRRRREALAL